MKIYRQLLAGAILGAAAYPAIFHAASQSEPSAMPPGPVMRAPGNAFFEKARKADASSVRTAAARRGARAPKKVPGSTLMWGNVTYMAEWPAGDRSNRGIYSFMSSAPVGYPLVKDADMQFCYGNAVVDGRFYGVTMDAERNATLYTLDIDSWQVVGTTPVADLSLVALATAEDYDAQVVYGEFYNKDFNGYELGVIDYATQSRTTIGPLNNTYVAMGFHDDILYGIATDGYLYAINASNGFENKRGATGLTLANAEGNYFMQGGDISPLDHTFYWAAIDKDGYTGMYTVDLSTGEATMCGSYTGIIYALTSPVESPTPADAPAAVTGYDAEMTDIYTAEVIFTLPSETFGGSPLAGEVAYDILCNGAPIESGVGQAGEKISRSLTLSTEGTAVLSVVARNASGKGATVNATLWVGYDFPLPARNVNASSDGAEVRISWTAPAGGSNDGYVGPLTYDIYRYVNGDKELVAEGITETSFSQSLPGESLHVLSYGIVADNNGKKSIETASNVLTVGESIMPDYFEDFRTAENFRLWTCYDSNNDGISWRHDPTRHYAYYQNAQANADDWLISPGIQLDSRRTYSVVVKANNTGSLPEKLEVKMGKNPTVTAMTTTVLEPMQFMQLDQREDKFVTHSNADVTVAKDGIYYLGLHAISDGGMNKLRVDSIYVEAGPLATAPQAVDRLSVTADPSGALCSAISFVAPTANIDGSLIEGTLQEIVVKRAGKVVKTFEDVAPGATLDFVDETPVEGYNEYRVIPWAENEFGQYASATVWVGYDMPATLSNVTATPDGAKVRLSWDKPDAVGAHGGVVDLNDLSYVVYDASLAYGFEVPGDAIGTTTSNEFMVSFDALTGPQAFKYWMVAPKNSKGEADKALVSLLAGEDYTLPFDEHFSNGAYEKFWHLEDKRNVNVAVWAAAGNSSEGDGGCLQMDNYASDEQHQAVMSGKIDISDAANPTLLFDIKTNSRVKGASAFALDAEGVRVELGNVEIGQKWTTNRLSLAQLIGRGPIQIAINVDFDIMDDTTWEYGTALIDNIKVLDLLKYNLFAEISAPDKVFAGLAQEPAPVSVTVKNTGEFDAEGFSVRLLENDAEIWKEDVARLSALANKSFTIPYAPSSEYDEADVTLKVVVEFEADELNDDNVAEHSIHVVASNAPAPEGVSVAEDTGLLSWSAPDSTPEVVLEDFESYAPWSTGNIGDWTLYDGDKGTVQGLFPSMTNPVEGRAYAFAIFDPRDYTGDGSGIDMTATYPRLTPHSGDHYLTATRASEGWNSVQQDNWIISPLLPCVDQEISFWVNNNLVDGYPYVETFSVWGSAKGKDVADFMQLTEDLQASSGEWTEIKAIIPSICRYFAIRQTSGPWETYFFMIDDITYARGGGDILRYNIFVDGEKVAEVDADTLEYQIPDTANDHVVAVSATYTNGLESKPVKVSYVSGVSSVFADGSQADIYSVSGVMVRSQATSLEGLAPGVYIVAGRKVLVK